MLRNLFDASLPCVAPEPSLCPQMRHDAMMPSDSVAKPIVHIPHDMLASIDPS